MTEFSLGNMDQILIHEVGFRDGLQMEKQTVPTEQKIKWIETLIGSGVDIVQLGSFVHPAKVPQMADTDDLFKHFTAAGRKPENVVLSGLVLNEKGLERGEACGVEMYCMGVSASETHRRRIASLQWPGRRLPRVDGSRFPSNRRSAVGSKDIFRWSVS
jgi:hydroxymethylglutaryl-CoA lyase